LFVAFETVGLYRLRRVSSLPALVNVGKDQLIEPVKTFGVTYHAIPDDGEFECEYAPEDPAQPGDVVAIGSDANAGEFLEVDLEGLSIISSVPGQTLMLASSQGDSSFHFYLIGRNVRHLCSSYKTGKPPSRRIPTLSTASNSMGQRSFSTSTSSTRSERSGRRRALKKPSTPNLQLPTPKSSGIHWNWGIGSWELTSVLAREKSAGRRRR
jgi:hypothetical protein